ncbi:acetyl-CoA carboxylase carboxyltransferase subunit alpha [Alkalibacterium sp. 20]|uniref:acetyl-CoA carboxylase carboxyltransferase subunit alpha n=1 Tax=Alkalibacterium sp. 20 TaxID=1798803 RepID=UPI0008FFF7B0|nr:acetyl-CoA carboxylase carboxyltransferase subunit alpha [Alkalibacterium sp. 20]OJF92494.1 acetyl-CoA carboxylase carboxyl transferase subunit alpha [Alkalibacterium sp. 20]
MSNAMEIVNQARKLDRLSMKDITTQLVEGFIELHGDRLYKDDEAIIGGIGKINGRPVTVIGNQKGSSIEENMRRNFGSPHPEGYRKSLRLMKQAEKFNRPIINFINTSGAYCGLEAEERGQGEAIANNLFEMSRLNVPILSIILGEGGSGGALALALADEVWMMEYSIYSILSPEGFASILWKDSKRSAEAADLMKLTSYDLNELGIVEKVIAEKIENQWINKEDLMKQMKIDIIDKLDSLNTLPRETLLEKRYERFREF